MLIGFPQSIWSIIDFYVYRLVDPRDYTTFYVGKGKGNRAFDHAKNAIQQWNADEDEISKKISRIRDIINAGKEVIVIIHRYGMTEEEALEVEAALIDAYQGLTNIQKGYGRDRGVTTADDLIKRLSLQDFTIPNKIDYVIIKTSNEAIDNNGNLYEATRKCWHVDIKKISKIPYVLSVIDGEVREVYEVDRWKNSSMCPGRSEFIGHVAPPQIRNCFVGKLIPAKYRKKGLASPVLYK